MSYKTPEENRAYQLRYRTEDKETYLAYRKAYYEKNKNKILGNLRDRYELSKKSAYIKGGTLKVDDEIELRSVSGFSCKRAHKKFWIKIAAKWYSVDETKFEIK